MKGNASRRRLVSLDFTAKTSMLTTIAQSMTPTKTPPPGLADLALFRSFDKSDRQALAAAGESLDICEGEILIREGHQHGTLIIVLAGRLQVTRAGESVAELRVGQLCGEMELLNPPSATASVTAKTDGTIWRLTREQLRQFMESHPAAGSRLMKLLAETFAARL